MEIYHKPPLYEMQCGHVSVVFYFKKIVEEIADFIAGRSYACTPTFLFEECLIHSGFVTGLHKQAD
jgi:hypothetical protein